MFELNENFSIKMKILKNSKIYIIDNFYKNPELLLEYFSTIFPPLWKFAEFPSYNSIYFEDRRHHIQSLEVKQVYKFLSFLCDRNPLNDDLISTNCIRFKKSDFNDYKNNYWWPHRDPGYTGIVYLNQYDNHSGTNLYECLNSHQENLNYPEHYQPWRNKNDYVVIETINPKYNRLVFFDGKKFLHGMNICNEVYFEDEYRFNQVFFFD